MDLMLFSIFLLQVCPMTRQAFLIHWSDYLRTPHKVTKQFPDMFTKHPHSTGQTASKSKTGKVAKYFYQNSELKW